MSAPIYDANGKPFRKPYRLGLLEWAGIVLVAQMYLMGSCRAQASEVTRQLSAGKSFSAIYLPSLPKISPDGKRVVYAQDAATNGANELWSVELEGGAPVRLSKAMIAGQSVSFALSNDSAHVIYLTDQDTLGTPELYSAPIAGGPGTKISRTLVAAGHVLDFHLAPASGQAYYRADAVTNNTVELWRVGVSGGPSTRVNRTLPNSNYDVFEYAAASATADTIERVVYRSGRSDVGGYKLYSNLATGSPAQAIEISRDLVTGGAVGDFRISPDGARVIYLADALDNGRMDLWSVPVTGGISTRLDRDNGRSVKAGFAVGELGVTYSYGPLEHYRVPVIGGASIQVPPPPKPPVTSPDGIWTVYPNTTELWSSRIGALRRVSCPGQVVTSTFLTQPTYTITPDSRTVVYIAGGELWASPITGAVCLIFRDGFENGNAGAWR